MCGGPAQEEGVEQKKTLVILNGRVESADIYELELAANIKDEEVLK